MSTPHLPRSRWWRVLRDRRSRAGLVMLAFVLFIAVFGPFLAPHGIEDYVASPYASPSADFWLGTDAKGQDVLSRLLMGGWSVVWMSVVAATIGTCLGTQLGMIAGYRKGWLDLLLMRVVDVWLALPILVFVLMFVSVFGRELWLLVLLTGLAHVPQVTRVVRSVAADVSTREYVESAKVLGSGALRTNLVQVLPNIMPTVLVEAGLRLVWSIGIIAGLNVLGLGVNAPAADWGLMIYENRPAFTFQPVGVLAPLLLIAIFAVGVNLLVEGFGRSRNVSLTEVSR